MQSPRPTVFAAKQGFGALRGTKEKRMACDRSATECRCAV